MSRQALDRAVQRLKKCRRLICCPRSFGTMNENNRKLPEIAGENNIPIEFALQKPEGQTQLPIIGGWIRPFCNI